MKSHISWIEFVLFIGIGTALFWILPIGWAFFAFMAFGVIAILVVCLYKRRTEKTPAAGKEMENKIDKVIKRIATTITNLLAFCAACWGIKVSRNNKAKLEKQLFSGKENSMGQQNTEENS